MYTIYRCKCKPVSEKRIHAGAFDHMCRISRPVGHEIRYIYACAQLSDLKKRRQFWWPERPAGRGVERPATSIVYAIGSRCLIALHCLCQLCANRSRCLLPDPDRFDKWTGLTVQWPRLRKGIVCGRIDPRAIQ